MVDGTDELDEAAARLYTTPPGRFVAARTALTRAARDAGERELAAALSGLRRPTTAAWLVNLLAHEPGALDPLDALAGELRSAQSRLDSAALRALGPRRRELLDELTRQALGLGRRSGPATAPGPAVREQVTGTLTAALASPPAARAVRSGRLVTALSYAGLGEVELAEAVAPLLRVVVPPPEAADGPGPAGDLSRADAPDGPEPSPPHPAGPSEQEILAARAAVERAHHALEVAQAALDQARARRTAARRALAEATDALEGLAGPPG